ncbi:hypothetical protein BKG89_08030 [Rodentibacter caecimuris]|uniref:Uncharacterized protein n=2 Tax=Rodentibacter caecimuris TaxID=1796644 RepID=A0ABX3KX33_9PAST|nr:hypothetical protein BKG89_08030 [Rodentibacter heylii]
MPSPFDNALTKADSVITEVMLSVFLINGKRYKAVLDESPNLMGDSYRDDHLINGTTRTLTLFKRAGYKPRLGDVVTQREQSYIVRGFSFVDDLIVLQLE